MSSHTTSDEEDEDFGPVLPIATSAVTPASAAAAVTPASAAVTAASAAAVSASSESDVTAPATKRERREQSDAPQSPEPTPADADAADSLDAAWERYRRQQLPSSPLYERSFTHTSLQDAHDAAAGAGGQASASPAVPAQAVHDVCVHLDSLGALVATVDAAGVVRVWRKLPRGLLFVTELEKVFSQPSAGAEGRRRTRRQHWAHAYTSLQVLVVVCVEEEDAADIDTLADAMHGDSPLSTVRVSVRQVNAVTFTVEARDTFTFPAPVQRVATTSAATLAYTRQPVFMIHQHAPHIAFFVSLPSASGLHAGGGGGGGGGGGSGVVLCPCFVGSGTARGGGGGGGRPSRSCTPTRLSVANPIVACVQQSIGVERAGTAACVLVDAAGIIDYCTIEPATDTPAAAAASSAAPGGLTLRVMAGLAAAPPSSREARVWRQWIRFDRRQRTGFFSLVRDAQRALAAAGAEEEEEDSRAAAAADVQVLPCAVHVTPDGRYVVVWSLRVTRVLVAAAAASHHPTTERHYTARVESCLHVLDFATGACAGTLVEPLGDGGSGAIAVSEDVAARPHEWAAHVQRCSRALATRVQVEPSSSMKNSFYVFVPHIPLEQLLGVGADAAGVDAVDGVVGRAVRVYEVTLAAAGAAVPLPLRVRRLPHTVGEWEAAVGRGPTQPPRHGRCDGRPAVLVRLQSPHSHVAGGAEAAVGVCRAPLLLLRCVVTASQDLKNLVAASPVGAALGAEARKHLLLPANAHGHVGDGGGAPATGDAVLLTTSADTSAAALLVYSCELPWGGAAVGRAVSDAAPAPEAAEAAQERQRRDAWATTWGDLHRGRDDACGVLLLLATGAPPTRLPATAAAAAAVTDAGDGVAREATAPAEAPGTVVAPAVRRAAPMSEEEVTVRTLLKDVLASSSSPPSPDSTATPVALIHVRGYGTVRVHLLPRIAPLATENFMRLARQRYYDRLCFHRVLPGAIVQGGCPRGDGTGGASAFADGATFCDEGLDVFPFFSHTTHRRCCWLCMANAGPDSNGSQFFFTVPGGQAMPWLNGHHTVFGYAVEGLDVVRAMSVAARDAEDKPLSPILMERVDVLSG
ncbi:cyclosporin 16 [Novymonas esmeraldas]|uniref:Cyclosporin 16 n=1 Tax=Novymonas esmeraldas TaxID=1808958 RepID=A0AAW0ETN5_9TRYP